MHPVGVEHLLSLWKTVGSIPSTFSHTQIRCNSASVLSLPFLIAFPFLSYSQKLHPQPLTFKSKVISSYAL